MIRKEDEGKKKAQEAKLRTEDQRRKEQLFNSEFHPETQTYYRGPHDRAAQ